MRYSKARIAVTISTNVSISAGLCSVVSFGIMAVTPFDSGGWRQWRMAVGELRST